MWDAVTVIAKAIAYAATLGAAGGVFFLFYCHDLASNDSERRIRHLITAALVIGVFASGARVFLLAGSMGGEIAAMFNAGFVGMILKAGEGVATATRIVGLLLAGHAVLTLRRPGWIALLGAAIAATSFAWVGHARAVASNGLPIFLISAHLLCVAFWLGALGPLLLMASDPNAGRIAAAASRFGRLAAGVVAMLIVAGAGLLWILVGDLSEFLSGAYGRAFVGKLGLVACLLSLAAVNKLRLTPRLRTNDALARQSLKRSIRFEIVLGGLILLVTAALTTKWGPPVLEGSELVSGAYLPDSRR